MIKVEKIETYGWAEAIRGMRNPMNSWDKSDSKITQESKDIGPNDEKLMRNLVKAGPSHRKFMRMITVYMDITAPLYWWKEFDTYKVGTVANSCSTMHKIADKEFTIDDFSHEHLTGVDGLLFVDVSSFKDGSALFSPIGFLQKQIELLNKCRERYLQTKDKKYWWQMIQLLPSSYNQKRTVMMNYETLHNIYEQRKIHKLYEWVQFCKIFKDANNIPLPWLITGEGASDKDQANSDFTEMFVKAGVDLLKAIRSGHDETSKWKDDGVNQSMYSTLDDVYNIYKNDAQIKNKKMVKLGNGINIAPASIRLVPEDSSEEVIDNVKKQMIEADNESLTKLGFRVNQNHCKEDTNTDSSTLDDKGTNEKESFGIAQNPFVVDFDILKEYLDSTEQPEVKSTKK